MSIIPSSLLAIILSVPVAPLHPPSMTDSAPVAYAISEERWEMQEGDKVIVDTLNNEGYIFHEDGRYLQFPIVTGQRRYVSYIGRYYFAATPNRYWVVEDMDIKWDRVTFGPSGRFLRLFWDGENTAYGFHEHRDEVEMFSAEAKGRYRSMGCVIVETDTMDLLVNTFLHNGNRLEVISQHGIDDLQEVMLSFEEHKENVEHSAEIALY